jgi:hypothetical protein
VAAAKPLLTGPQNERLFGKVTADGRKKTRAPSACARLLARGASAPTCTLHAGLQKQTSSLKPVESARPEDHRRRLSTAKNRKVQEAKELKNTPKVRRCARPPPRANARGAAQVVKEFYTRPRKPLCACPAPRACTRKAT